MDWRALVEAPGTAPGSDRFIATTIYFHSRRTGTGQYKPKLQEKQCRIVTPCPEYGHAERVAWPPRDRRL